MSTKTTFKRIALVAVAALGFGVLSVVPSQADVTGLTVTATNGTGASVFMSGESATAASLRIQFLSLDAGRDSVTVSIVPAAALPTGATIAGAGLFFTESTTSTGTLPRIDTETTVTLGYQSGKAVERRGAITLGSYFRVISGDAANATQAVTVRYSLGETTTAGNNIVAGTYSFNAVVVSRQAGASVTQVVPFSITVAAAPVVVVTPAAANAKAYIQATTTYPTIPVFADSATAGSNLAGTVVGTIRASNFSATDVAARDTFTVTMTGNGYLRTVAPASAITGRSFTVIDTQTLTLDVVADGSSGTGTITITTGAGASFVKTATFFDTHPVTAVATVAKAFIMASTASVSDVFAITVRDSLGNAITQGGVVVTAAPTDTRTTQVVGGAATCAWNAVGNAYHCGVAGLASDKYGPVAYTITATGTGINAAVRVTTSATVTFADNVATKAVLAGPSTGTPGAVVDYTLTLTEKNGYPVADQTYGVGGLGGALFSQAAADTVASGFTGTLPFSVTESFTSKSGVITSKGTLAIAGTASLSLTLIGDGLQTLAGNAIDKAIGKTKVTVSTDITNPGVDAATDAANEATDAALAAAEAALAAAEAADAATSAAQEASDAVAALSESVTKLIAGLQTQIRSLAAVVAKIARKVKA